VLKQHKSDTQQYQALDNLRLLALEVEDLLERGENAFGHGTFKLFDFVHQNLPEQDVT